MHNSEIVLGKAVPPFGTLAVQCFRLFIIFCISALFVANGQIVYRVVQAARRQEVTRIEPERLLKRLDRFGKLAKIEQGNTQIVVGVRQLTLKDDTYVALRRLPVLLNELNSPTIRLRSRSPFPLRGLTDAQIA